MTISKFDWRQHLEFPSTNNDIVDVADEEIKDKNISSKSSVEMYRSVKYMQHMKTIFEDYCNSSSMHGVRYFTEPKRHWSGRVWWAIAITMSIFGFIYFSKELYSKWQKSPVIVSFAEKYTRVSEIPFPAVTICSETKSRSSILNFTSFRERWKEHGLKQLEIQEKEKIQSMIAVLQICSDEVNLDLKESTDYSFTDDNIFKMIQEVAPTFNETMINCKFQNENRPCSFYFREVITEEGLCYTFNSLELPEIYSNVVKITQTNNFENVESTFKSSTDYWSLDKGYFNHTNSPYPLRVFGSGSRDGLAVTLKLNPNDFDETCRSHVQGFKVQLHMAGVIPQLSKHYFHVPMQRDVLVSVNPQIIKTDEDLNHYTPDIRQCFFSNEKQLKFFKSYTKPNCDLECLTNFTLQKCSCVRFSMPREQSTKICGIEKIDCCIAAEDELLKNDDFLLYNDTFDDCNCLPSCTSYSYDTTISQNIIRTKLNLSNDNETAVVRIFFNKKQFISSKRSKLYGQTELLANFGGLLGFFLGISFLTFVEIIYFFTLRTFLSIRKIFFLKRAAGRADSSNNYEHDNNITQQNAFISEDRPSFLIRKLKKRPMDIQQRNITVCVDPIQRFY